MKKWYDGFCFGNTKDIYNPWSILNYLDNRAAAPYWVNTSSNHLIGKLLQEGNKQVKETSDEWDQVYELSVTNFEVLVMLKKLVRSWFAPSASNYNEFIKALMQDDIKAMNLYMNRIALSVFSFFDTGKKPSEATEPERLHAVKATAKSLKGPNSSVCFYHGFVLGLIVDLEERYRITSNRESGFGRYDIMLEPKNGHDPAIIIEFKIQEPEEEKDLSQTVEAALRQIDAKNYAVELLDKGIQADRIRKYGFAFCGKTVLVGKENTAYL